MKRGARAGTLTAGLVATAAIAAAAGGRESGEPAAPVAQQPRALAPSSPPRPPAPRQRLWALLVAGSHGWENHRHQADVLAQYRLLRSRGVSDERIVLVAAGDLAYDDHNPKPGTVRQVVGGENLARDVEVDYRPDQLSARDLTRIITGKRSRTIPHAIRSRRHDNVYVFLAGHGNRRGFYVGLDQAAPRTGERYSLLTPRRLGAAVDRLAAARRYRRLLVAVEACNAGVFGSSVRAPGAALLAAAGPNEKSLSANYDPKGGVWLADEFSYRLQAEARTLPASGLTATYRRLRRTVRGSDPGAFGSLRGVRLGEFFSP